MVRTARLPLDRQLAEGTFDLCLIDFGSSLALEPASAVAKRLSQKYSRRKRDVYAMVLDMQ